MREYALLRDQLAEGAALDDAAAVQHQDVIGVGDRGEAVRDDEGGAALRSRSSARLMRASVSTSSALVASSRIRIGAFFEDGAGDGDALALAARQRGAALADDELVGAGLLGDEIVRLGQPRGLLDLGVGGLGPADADVLGDRAVEQAGVLEHHRHVVAQRVERHVADVVRRRR